MCSYRSFVSLSDNTLQNTYFFRLECSFSLYTLEVENTNSFCVLGSNDRYFQLMFRLNTCESNPKVDIYLVTCHFMAQEFDIGSNPVHKAQLKQMTTIGIYNSIVQRYINTINLIFSCILFKVTEMLSVNKLNVSAQRAASQCEPNGTKLSFQVPLFSVFIRFLYIDDKISEFVYHIIFSTCKILGRSLATIPNDVNFVISG